MLRNVFSLLLLGAVFSCSTPALSPETPAAPAETPSSPSSSAPSSPVIEDITDDNLVFNASVEEGSGERPTGWRYDNWGDNTASVRWARGDAAEGERYLSIDVSNHKTGDTKWIYAATRLEPDQWYEYQDSYRSDGRSRLLIFCNQPDGNRFFKNAWQTHAQPRWKVNKFRFYSGIYKDCETSVMHVMDRNGFLHTDKHQLKKVAARPLERPLVSFTFDDIWKTAVDAAAPELEQRNWKGSFYITREFTQGQDTPEYAKPADIDRLLASGHEVGTHGDRHSPLSTLNRDALEKDLKETYEYVQDLGATASGIAYPFGDFSAEVETEAKRYHDYARTSLTGLNDKALNPFRLKVVSVDNETKTAELLNWIDMAEKTRTWVIFLFHDLSDVPGSFQYTTSLSQYKTLLEYVERKNLTVLPVNEALKEAQR